jgi:hypothetical protein
LELYQKKAIIKTLLSSLLAFKPFPAVGKKGKLYRVLGEYLHELEEKSDGRGSPASEKANSLGRHPDKWSKN